MYEQRDIVLIPFPYSDLTGSKKRPAIIISNKKINKTKDRVCCLVTTNKRADDLDVDKRFLENGNLPFESFVRAQRIFTVHEGIIIKKLCTITGDFHDKIIGKIQEYTKRR